MLNVNEELGKYCKFCFKNLVTSIKIYDFLWLVENNYFLEWIWIWEYFYIYTSSKVNTNKLRLRYIL